MKNHYPANINIVGNEISIENKKFPSEGNLLLLNCANPANPDKYASLIYCNNMENTDQLRRLFHYLSYSMLLVNQSARPGKPLSSMEIFPTAGDRSRLEYNFSK